jgi:hypothetical protein
VARDQLLLRRLRRRHLRAILRQRLLPSILAVLLFLDDHGNHATDSGSNHRTLGVIFVAVAVEAVIPTPNGRFLFRIRVKSLTATQNYWTGFTLNGSPDSNGWSWPLRQLDTTLFVGTSYRQRYCDFWNSLLKKAGN